MDSRLVRACSASFALALCVACGDDARTVPDAGAGDAGAVDAGVRGCGSAVTTSALERGAWDERFTIAGLGGHDGIAPSVYDFARAPDGSLLVVGRFQWLAGEEVAPFLRLRADGTWEPARTTWELPVTLDGFAAIAVSETGAIALATNDSFGERSGAIWIDEGAGLRVLGRFTGQVRSLAFFGDRLWVAGLFAMGETDLENLATWDGSAWSAPPGGAIEGIAYELFVDAGSLYVGGAFTHLGGIDAQRVAAYDGETWRALDLSAGWIFAIARGGDGALYAGGAQLGYGDTNAGAIVRWDGAAWQPLGPGLAQGPLPGVVTDIVPDEGGVDVTGCFGSIGPAAAEDARPADSLARWDGTAWHPLDLGDTPVMAPWFQPAVCGDEGPAAVWDATHQRLARVGDTLFAGGSFAGAGGVLSQALVAHDGERWVAQGAGELGIGGSLDRLAVAGEGCEVYGMGALTHAAGEPVTGRVVRFTGAGWEPIRDTIPLGAFCPAFDASRDGRVVVGCMEAPADDGSRGGILLEVRGDELVALSIEALPPVHWVQFAPDGTLWVSGGDLTGFVGTVEGETLTIVEDGFDGPVSRVDVAASGEVIAGGFFTRVGDVSARNIARRAGSAWSALGEGVPGQVMAIARDAERVYVSTSDLGEGALLLGAFDGTTWRELATAEAGLTAREYFTFETLRVIDGALLGAGTVDLDDGSGRGALMYRDGRFRAIGGGVRAMWLGSIVLTDDAMWVGGIAAEAGHGDTRVPSVGIARFAFGE